MNIFFWRINWFLFSIPSIKKSKLQRVWMTNSSEVVLTAVCKNVIHGLKVMKNKEKVFLKIKT